MLRKAQLKHTEILPLYARLSPAEQQRIFQSHPGRRVVLATNVAETSLTVPGIRYVIDSGTARISRYSYRAKVQRLPIEAISQASANQRKGRCGRVEPGFVRLYSEEDFLGRPEFTDRRSCANLAAVILQMLHLRLGEITAFPFIEPPDGKAISDGFNLLQELSAVDRNSQLTPLAASWRACRWTRAWAACCSKRPSSAACRKC
jgi:ATP-dependent helicase HrpA